MISALNPLWNQILTNPGLGIFQPPVTPESWYSLLEQEPQTAGFYTTPSLPSILQVWEQVAPLSVHRDSGETTPYLPTALMAETGLSPSVLHCEMDALGVSSHLFRKEFVDVRILEIRRATRGPLTHERSIWLQQGVNVYEYGIHYAAMAGDRVFDLQSLIGNGMEVGAYLAASFPGQAVTTTRHWPNDLRGTLKFARDFRHLRHDGYKDYPELIDDPRETRPPIKTLQDIMREARERRLRREESPKS